MTTTFANLITRIQITVNDEAAATWDTEMLATFLNDAIRDYSVHFPRVLTDSIALTTGTAVYDLAADFQGVLSVEYPDGEDPRQYLARRPYTSAAFAVGAGAYDIIPRLDDDDPSQIIFSDDVATGETAVIEYNAHHALIANTAADQRRLHGNAPAPGTACEIRPLASSPTPGFGRTASTHQQLQSAHGPAGAERQTVRTELQHRLTAGDLRR